MVTEPSRASRSQVLLDAAAAVNRVADGMTVTLPVGSPADADLVRRWSERQGHEFLGGTGDSAVTVRRGLPATDPVLELPEPRRPGYRLWLYTNFDCNLACDYCCVSSSPRTPRRALGAETVRQLAAEAPDAGVKEIYLTGGEPFLLADIDQIVEACATVLPTTVLTNGMLFRGRRLEILENLPRERFTLQISLDSADAGLHDLHRGEGSQARALAGMMTARALGFRVRLAATLDAGQSEEEDALHELCDAHGIDPDDRVIRRVAHQGVADHGVVVSRSSLVPEVCVTAEGVYWHPVAAIDPGMRVRQDPFPLHEAIADVTAEFVAHRRRAGALAATFPCA